MKKIFYILIFVTSLVFAGGFNDFSQFEKFEKADMKTFLFLKREAKKCIKDRDFNCSKEKIKSMKKYIVTKKDKSVIIALKESLADEMRKKREEELAALNSNKHIRLSDCRKSSSGHDTNVCTIYVNGKYDGGVFYYYNHDNSKLINIFILGSKNAKINNGYYDTSLNSVWTTNCGKTRIGEVRSLSKALYYFANCSINGRY